MTESGERIKKLFKDNIYFLIVLIICSVYVVRSLITIGETGKTITEILADGIITMVFGYLINSILSAQGVLSGQRNEKYISTVALHAKAVEDITPYQDKLDDWCEKETAYTLKKKRSSILQKYSISYDSVFGKQPIDIETLSKEKQKCINKARKAKITPLTSASLTSEGANANDKYNFGQSTNKYLLSGNMKQIFSKVIFGIIAGYYGVEPLVDKNYAQLIWYCIQIAIFLGMGMIMFIKSYFFVVEDYRHAKIRKIDILQKFKVDCENGYTVKGEGQNV